MWASCCGLLNEVMGTGAVRGQQSGFAGGTGPFRFAPNSDFSTYPSVPMEGPNIVCKACGLSFSVFRKKHVCCDCKKDFCSVCSVLQENLRRCSTCHLLQETAFQRPQLMRLKVKDLRQYLILRNIPIDTCREKEDLVDLVLCHHGLGSEDDLDTSSLNSSRSQSSGFFAHSFFSNHTAPSATVSSFQGDFMGGDQILGSGVLAQVQSEIASANTEEEDDEDDDEDDGDDDDEENLEERTPGLSEKRVRASLSDLSSLEDVEGMSVRQLKEILARNFVNYSGCCEKWELVEKVNRLYKENEENQKSYGERLQLQDEEDDRLCRICMDAVIDCVLLECGHMVTCTKCGKRMISVSTSWRHHLITNCLQLPRPKTPVCSMQPPGAASRERLRKQTPPAHSPVAVATPSDHGRYFIQLWSEAPTQK
ncbi:E3 ubiquitin-protein ligase RNF34 isoform X5 [Canis lupus familiaris]|nr:E3 ubiquitin-protein ligase RNF34 isoform X5 [Canis lupus familiaris]XP_022266400.2 E3 ubiquitin-protein ligase RNF34 isoform X5 [Canis lupus familiaris]XP_038315303.1 E3 ubiquitin-protein ligase RNF34 isoform X5 [Canis lupus familiaris]